MIDGLGKDNKTTEERNGAIAGCGDKDTLEDIVFWKRVEGTDRLMVDNEIDIHRDGNGYIRRKYQWQ